MYVQEKYYKILESTKYDDIETIGRNYKQIIFDNHPDRGGDENFAKEVNVAWEIIKKHHIQQTRQSNNQKTNNKSTNTHKIIVKQVNKKLKIIRNLMQNQTKNQPIIKRRIKKGIKTIENVLIVVHNMRKTMCSATSAAIKFTVKRIMMVNLLVCCVQE